MPRHALLAVLALLLLGLPPAYSGKALAGEAQPGVLEISGKIAAATTRLDVAGLRALGTVTFTTTTPWTEGPVEFEAVPGDRLLAAVGAKGTAIDAVATDGYKVTIPIEDFTSGQALIAIAMDGEPLPPDEFGPFWVIYQYDKDPVLRDEAHQARSIWQLKALVVK